MRDAVLTGASLDHLRGTQKLSKPSRVVSSMRCSHLVADTYP
jgi:hypothetical protein